MIFLNKLDNELFIFAEVNEKLSMGECINKGIIYLLIEILFLFWSNVKILLIFFKIFYWIFFYVLLYLLCIEFFWYFINIKISI